MTATERLNKPPSPEKRLGYENPGRPSFVANDRVMAALDKYVGPGTGSSLMDYLGISSTVFYRWYNNPDDLRFYQKVDEIRSRVNEEVEVALLKRAKGFKETTVDIKDSDKDGRTVTTKEHVFAPDTGAALSWLANRNPEKWKNKKTIEIEGNHIDNLLAALEDGNDAEVDD